MTLRIAFAVHDARPGGGQDRYALELVNRLSANHQVTLLARSADGLASPVTFHKIDTPNRPGPLRATVFARKVRRVLAGGAWDIVHTIGGAYPGATVITAQYCQAGWQEASRRWPSSLTRPAERAYRALETHLALRHERRAATHPALLAMIGVSQRTLGEWKAAYGANPRKTAVIPNAVDIGRFQPGDAGDRTTLKAELRIPDSAPLLLLVGALVRKGIETALQSLVHLGSESHLLAIGAGPHSRIRSLASRLGVADRLRIRSPVSDIERYYRGCDLFLFPTRYEPFGMVIAEAWAAGLPVVCAGTAGALEWAKDGRDVLNVDDPTDAEGFADAARRILTDRDLASRLASAGRELAVNLSWERVVRETEAVYGSRESIVDGR